MALTREYTGVGGDMAGHYLRGLAVGDRWVWRNPFPGARMFDDEIAVATVMELMARYTEGGPGFCAVADAAQDHYLYLCLQQAAEHGRAVQTTPQSWDDQLTRPVTAGARLPEPVIEDRGPAEVPRLA